MERLFSNYLKMCNCDKINTPVLFAYIYLYTALSFSMFLHINYFSWSSWYPCESKAANIFPFYKCNPDAERSKTLPSNFISLWQSPWLAPHPPTTSSSFSREKHPQSPGHQAMWTFSTYLLRYSVELPQNTLW